MSQHAAPGLTVVVRDEQWRVARVDAFERCAVVTLEAIDHRRLRVIEPFDRVTPIGTQRIVRRRRHAVLRTAMNALSAGRPPLALWTAARASIELLPYQLEPALAVLQGATRVLLADAVGLGKTIQAALILAELRARGLVERALVLCPAGLRTTWAHELQHRFGIACAVFDHASLGEAVATLPPGINPWSTHTTLVTSIDFAKRPEVLAAIGAVPIDLVIADEAHHLTPGTDRGAAAGLLASRSPWCVLLSATPHSGDDAAFNFLTGLGAHGDAIAIFRRSRGEAALASARRERLVRVLPSAAESELLDAVDQYARAIWRARGAADPAVQLVAITIARRAASSLLALERTLRRRLALLGSSPAPVQGSLPWDEEDDADGSGSPQILARRGLDSEADERAALEHLLTLIGGCGTASKLRWLSRALGRIREPVIVFTEYRDTLDAVLALIPNNRRADSLCGATPISLRRAAVDTFNRGDTDVLVATDTAGEGLNLHHRCRLVIDVELPWNPMRLEQRVGRVDRIGQRRRVHALRLFHPDTVEERVLERMQLRRRRAESIDGPAAIDEQSIAASVLGAAEARPTAAPPIASRVVAGVQDEHARLVEQRRHSESSATVHVAGAAPPRRATTTMIALHGITFVNDLGSIVAEESCAHEITVDARRAARPADVLEAIAREPRLRQSLRSHCEVRCADITDEFTASRGAVTSRLAAIRSRLAEQRATEVQRSLFDGRAQTAAAERATVLINVDAALCRRQRGLDASVRPEAAATRLVAVWPADGR